MSVPASRDLLAEAVLNSGTLLKRYLAGFDDSNRCFQTLDLPNHPAWTLGHLAITMVRAQEKLGGPGPDPDRFVTGDGTRGDAQKFDTESVSFGSTPVADPAKYPTFDRCVEIFDRACEDLARTIRSTPDDKLAGMVQWGSAQIPGYAAALRMVFHNGTHTGQLADLRRALRLKSVFA